ncbi:MAG: sulfotransferase family protein [Longimicrobiales bacterium]
MLPNFLIIGAQRSGTTTLHRVVGLHPEVFTTPRKELYFFSGSKFKRGAAWYERQFRDWDGEAAVGESSPDYMLSNVAAGRIRELLPDARLILILRNPVERVYSAYWNDRLNLARSHASFEEALARDEKHLARGFYMNHINRYLALFRREQLLVTLHDDLRTDPVELYRTCFRFLGVSDTLLYPEMSGRFNQTKVQMGRAYRFFVKHPRLLDLLPRRTGARRLLKIGRSAPYSYPPMNAATRRRLTALYADSNRQLSHFLGRDLSHWNEAARPVQSNV